MWRVSHLEITTDDTAPRDYKMLVYKLSRVYVDGGCDTRQKSAQLTRNFEYPTFNLLNLGYKYAEIPTEARINFPEGSDWE